MRMFIAFELPRKIRAEMERIQHQLRRNGAQPVRWVAPDSCHLTVQFLGEVEPATVPPMLESLGAIQWGTENDPDSSAGMVLLPRLRLAPVGAFPNVTRPQTIWMGVTDEQGCLNRVYQAITGATEPHGFVPERRSFHPHLTLGRVRNDATPTQVAALSDAITRVSAPEPLSWQCEPPVLFHSTLTPGGPIYRKIPGER